MGKLVSMCLLSPALGAAVVMTEASDRLKKKRLSTEEERNYLFERLLDEHKKIKSEDYYTFLLNVYVEKVMYKEDEFSRLFNRVMAHSYNYNKELAESHLTVLFRMSTDFKFWVKESKR